MACYLRLFGKKYQALRSSPDQHDRPTVWTDSDVNRYPRWLSEILDYNEKLPQELHPAVQELESLIENNVRIRLLASSMCDQLVAEGDQKPKDARVNAIRSPRDLLRLLNYMLKVPPLWNTHMFMIGLEAAPFYLLLLDAMHTECGFAFFLDPEVNTTIKRIMNAWGDFLQTPESAACLNDSSLGWFGPEAYTHLTNEANLGDELYSFEDMYVCDPSKVNRGFISWDDYFTRHFRDGIRPVANPGDDSVIANVCESMPWRITHKAKHEDKFWAKGGAYSLKDMLAHDEFSKQFIGGTVYQAYLSALAYHRWHSPVSGKIVQAYKIPGTYFSEPLHKGFGKSNGQVMDDGDPNWAQSYLSSTATRAVVFIEADNPDIGLMGVILIGMGEVSSCELTVMEGQRVRKGDQIGLFHFGGSTHCVLFRPGVEVVNLPDPKSAKQNVPVRGQLGRIVRKQQQELSEKSGL